MTPLLYFNCSHPELLAPFSKWKNLGKGARSSGCNCSAILDNYEIENPREVWEITSEWLLITGSLTTLCATPTPYQ
jgi:hypothetical protein